jgi:hypothetical protein
MNRIIAIASLAALLAACATAPVPETTYVPASNLNSPGYLTTPADNGRYTVAYTGTKGMSREQVAQFALLRAAEFTAESGKEWFAVIDTKAQSVKLAAENKDQLKSRSGGFIGGDGGSSTGSGAAGGTTSPKGVSDSTTSGGSRSGGFGGGDVPYQVLERWTPPTVFQTVIVIQMGSGEKATFPGVAKAPEIYAAKTMAAEIRGKMKH